MCAQHVDDGLAAPFGEVDFDAEAETFLRDEDGGKMSAVFENAESLEIAVFVELGAFGEAFGV